MPYKSKLTKEKYNTFIEIIIKMYDDLCKSDIISIACAILCMFHELFCSYYFIDTDADVKWDVVCKNMKLTKDARSFADILKQFRDNYYHTPYDIDFSEYAKLFRNYASENAVADYCAEFTNDPSIAYILKDTLRRFCEHYSRRY